MNSFRFSSLLIALLCFCTTFARTEYDEVSEKDIKAAATAEAKFNQVTADNYHYIYWVYLNAPVTKNGNCTITIDNPSLGPTVYKINDYAGSAIRKELRCTDRNGDEVTIVFKLEEMPDAKNSSVLKMYVDKYPGRRPNQKSIDATCENNLYALKNYGGASILYSKTNSRVTEPKKYKAGIYTTLFEWINAHLGK